MLKIFKKTLKMFILDVYVKNVNVVIVNSLLLVLIVVLQFGDITIKVSSNYIILTWISINSYLFFTLFNRKK